MFEPKTLQILCRNEQIYIFFINILLNKQKEKFNLNKINCILLLDLSLILLLLILLLLHYIQRKWIKKPFRNFKFFIHQLRKANDLHPILIVFPSLCRFTSSFALAVSAKYFNIF